MNLRDFEGRSALLLGKAKDNNASCAIGPFIRLFDDGFTLDDVRRAEIVLDVDGADGFHLRRQRARWRRSAAIRCDLVAQATGSNHQYPDGFMLFLGTMFAPVDGSRRAGHGLHAQAGRPGRSSAPRARRARKPRRPRATGRRRGRSAPAS